MLPACLLSFSTGFLSLSIEILWIRLFCYANHSFPQGFPFVLMLYLIGIAAGAELGKRFCNTKLNLWLVSGFTLVFSSLFDLISPWLYAVTVFSNYNLKAAAILIFFSALLKAIVFPIAHHLGAEQNDISVGRRVSMVYVSNIFGATIGPLITGFFLLSQFSTQQSFIICAMLTLVVALCCLMAKAKFYFAGLSAASATLLLYAIWGINPNLLINIASPMNNIIRRVVENQYGIIQTYYGGKEGDIVAGGNVYDGRTNLDPAINSNGINRVIVLAALNDHPANVLVIGLSIGTWLKILGGFPGVKHIDVVEINPGYLTAIGDYPLQKSMLSDPRVDLHIDDGRRWLKLHPDNKYDLIVMNTSFYWRIYVSNVLSQEFISLLKQHMNSGAIIAYNTTNSPHAFKTASTVFKHAYLYENFLIGADFDWRKKMRGAAAEKKLTAITLDGKPLFASGSEGLIRRFLDVPTKSIEEIEPFFIKAGKQVEVITDRNLITEYKYGVSLS